MSSLDEPRWEPFAGKPLEQWTRAELTQLAGRQRRDPPKLRTILNALDAAGVDAVSALDADSLQDLRRDLNQVSFAPWSRVLRAMKPKRADE